MPTRSSIFPTDTRRGGRDASNTFGNSDGHGVSSNTVLLVALHQPTALATADW